MKFEALSDAPIAPNEISERQSEIAELVRADGFAGIDQLAERFEVTTQTIRKDVNQLCELGFVRRVHGGVQRAVAGNLQYRTRRVLRLSAKRKVAAAVAREIPNGASIAVSIGTTPETVIAALAQHRNLKIYTNNLHVAMVANEIDTVEVTIPGGAVRKGDGDIVGRSAVEFFSSYKVDYGIFGVAAVDEDGDLLDFHEEEVEARQAILRNCRQTFLVLDGMKFERKAHVRGGHITDVDRVFCDAPPPARIADRLDASRVPLTLCVGAGA